MDGSTYGYNFVGVDALVGSLAEEFLDNLLYGGDTCRTAYEDDFVDVVGCQAGVLEGLTAGAEGGVDQAVGQLLEFGTCQCLNEVFGHSVYGHDVRQIDFGAGGAGQLDFGLFGGFFEALQCHRILTKVYAFVFLEFVGQPVDDYVVKVIAAQVGVAVGGFNFEYAVTQFEDGYIECAAAEVEYGNFLIFLGFVKTIGKCCGGRLVDDTFYGKACDFAGFLGGLTLAVVEVGRYGDDCFGDALSEIIFGGFLHFLKNHCRDFLRRILASVYIDSRRVVVAANHFVGHALNLFLHFIIGFTHEAFDGVDGAFGVGDSLALGGIAHFALAAVDECYYRRCCVATFAVRYHYGVFAFENGYTRISGAEVYTNNLSHDCSVLAVCICFLFFFG